MVSSHLKMMSAQITCRVSPLPSSPLPPYPCGKLQPIDCPEASEAIPLIVPAASLEYEIRAIAMALGVSAAWLLGEEDRMGQRFGSGRDSVENFPVTVDSPAASASQKSESRMPAH